MKKLIYLVVLMAVILGWLGKVQAVDAVGCTNMTPQQCASAQLNNAYSPENSTIDKAAGKEGEKGLVGLGFSIADMIRQIVFYLGVFMLVYIGIKIVASMDNAEAVKKNWSQVKWVGIGIIVIYFVPDFVRIIAGFGSTQGPAQVMSDLKTYIKGPIVGFLMNILAIVAIFSVVLSGMRILTSAGNADIIKKNTRNAIATGLGLILILLAEPIVNDFFNQDATGKVSIATTSILIDVFKVVRYGLSYLAIAGVVLVIYAGMLIVVNFGKDDRVKQGYKILRYAIIGIIIIFCAYVIVTAIAAFNPNVT